VDDSLQVLDGALRTLRMTGALFLQASFSEPWALESSDGTVLANRLRPGAQRVILFHVVTEGRFHVALPDGTRADLGAGDVVILPYADRHVMRGTEPARPVPIGSLFPPQPWPRIPALRHGGGGAPTSIVCGYLYSDDMHLSPMLAALPPLMPVRAESDAFREWLLTSVRYAVSAPPGRGAPGDMLVQGLPELLFSECLRAYARQQAGGGRGWIAAVVDPVVGRAMALMHRDPAQSWTLPELARAAAASRSVLDERFHRLLDCGPMQYLATWRLQLAGRQLRDTRRSVGAIANAVGYESEASFSRAFKRLYGVSPRAWRRPG
jgi:AraC-like DNA-binding protein